MCHGWWRSGVSEGKRVVLKRMKGFFCNHLLCLLSFLHLKSRRIDWRTRGRSTTPFLFCVKAIYYYLTSWSWFHVLEKNDDVEWKRMFTRHISIFVTLDEIIPSFYRYRRFYLLDIGKLYVKIYTYFRNNSFYKSDWCINFYSNDFYILFYCHCS